MGHREDGHERTEAETIEKGEEEGKEKRAEREWQGGERRGK